ncbi:Uncharacterised protein [Mycobacteroides abscessus subsp. abscessus]|nr:Uncharacterised protein [Mycobacteroides abscessus subsp. abscessus]
MVQAVDGLMQVVADLLLEDLLRHRDLDLVEQRGDGLVADLVGLRDALAALHLLGEAVLELADGVEFACQLCKVVVGGRQLTLLDGADLDGDLGLLAGELAGGQLGGEHLLLAGLQPDDGLVQAIDQLSGADLVRQTGGRGLLDLLAVNGGRQIDRDEVAVLGGALDALEGAEPGAQRVQLGLDLGVLDGDGLDGDGNSAQVGQLDLGAHIHLSGECQLLTVFDLGDLDLRLAQRLDVGGGDGLAVAGRQGRVDDLLQHRGAADAGLKQLGGSLAGAETGQANLLRQLLVGLGEIWFELCEGNLDVDANPGRAQLFDGALHVQCSFVIRGRPS